MNFTRYISTTNWSPRSIFVVAFLCCIVIAQAQDVDPRFDKGSASLARKWQHIKGSFPHEKIPDNAEEIKDISHWGVHYAIGLVKICGPGIAIALLSLLGGIIYGIFKLIRLCCCSSDDEEEGGSSSDSEEDEKYKPWKVLIPTIIYGVCWVFVLTGMIFGLLNNPRFSDGVTDMGDNVILVGNEAVDLGNGLLSNVTSIVALIPTTIDDLENQFSGVDPLANDLSDLSDSINATSGQVSNVTNEVAQIDAGNTTAVINLYAQLASINNQSQQVISQMTSLTDQIAVQLHNTLNSTLDTLDTKVGEIDDTVDGIEDTARGIINQADKLVREVIDKVNDAKSYDKTRGKVVLALFVIIIIITFSVAFGYIFRKKVVFNIIAAFCFLFLFLMWLSGSIHFILGMALYDACPVIDATVQGLLPTDSQAAVVLQGCLYEHRSVLDSMNITAYNLTDVFDYKTEFESFADFSENFNFSSVDSYFDSINTLYEYNLTQVADNMTVANFGWNDTVIYTPLGTLNNATYPTYYDLTNYTNANANSYTYPKNQTVYDSQQAITSLLELNQTIYNKTAVAKRQLYAAQHDIDTLLANMAVLHQRFDNIRAQVNILQTQNITNCINSLDSLQNNITVFFELGNCSFLSESYIEIRTSLCQTMQPAIDCLTVAQFLAGIALIPIAIIAEVLSFRVPKNKIIPCGWGYEEDEESGGKESHRGKEKVDRKDPRGDYAVAMTDSPVVNRRNSGLTATISTAPASNNSSTESTPASTPDFNAGRKNQVHVEAPPQITQNYVLPPIRKKGVPQ